MAALIRAAGVEDVQILRVAKDDGGPGGPAVVARKAAAPGFPTVVLYAHHDVQPPGDAQLWDSEPFVAQERDGRLYGRGAADDKAGIMAHIAAFSAVQQVLGADFGVGVTFFIEGEEEAGSPTFRTFLQEVPGAAGRRRHCGGGFGQLAGGHSGADHQPARPGGRCCGGRGDRHAVHSGMFGGPLLDAPTLLARLIATFHDEQGSVAIKGLLRSEDTDVDYAEDTFRADAGVLPGVQLAGRGTIASRLWTQPALSVIGMDMPSVEMSSNTLLPTARAKISLRLAPGQDPAAAMAAVAEHVQANAPFGAHASFVPGEAGQSFATDTRPRPRRRRCGPWGSRGVCGPWKRAWAAPFPSLRT